MKPSVDCQIAFGRGYLIAVHGLMMCVFLLLASCAVLPEIQPISPPQSEGVVFPCERPFVKDKWQFVHSIKAVLPNDQRQSMIGTTIVSPREDRIQCILLSIEGLVLLDVVSDRQVTVNRAVPPFDDPEMVQGLIRDVRLLFLKPDGRQTEFGTIDHHGAVCRYRNRDGSTVDVVVHPDGSWEIRGYDTSDNLNRMAKGVPAENHQAGFPGESVPERLELTAYGFVGYKLTLDLIEAIPLFAQEPSA